MDEWAKSIFIAGTASIVSAIGVLLGFCPRLNRAEKDIETKLSKEVFMEVRTHIDGKFEAQEQMLHRIQALLVSLKTSD